MLFGCAISQPATAPTAVAAPSSTVPPIEQEVPSVAAQLPTRPLARPAAEQGAATIYLPRLFEDGSLGLRAASRPASLPDDPLRAAIDALLLGPNAAERADDFEYPLDPRSRLRSVTVNGGTATLDFETGIDQVYGRPFSELVFWSIVYTATEVPGVERVALAQGGTPLRQLGEPAVSIPAAASRADAPDWVRPR